MCICVYVYMSRHILCICAQLCLTFCDPKDSGLPDQIFHWSKLPFPSPGDFPDMYIGIHTFSTHNGILVSYEREILSFATTWIDFECIMLTEISQIEKDKYCKMWLIYSIIKKSQTPKRLEKLLQSGRGNWNRLIRPIKGKTNMLWI